MNNLPRSGATTLGTLKCDIQLLMKALAQEVEVACVNGNAYGHRLKCPTSISRLHCEASAGREGAHQVEVYLLERCMGVAPDFVLRTWEASPAPFCYVAF